MSVKLSVVIVSYKVKELLRQCLYSLIRALENIDSEIFVVDNASFDGTPDMIKELFPEVILMELKENCGYAKANNKALKLSKGEYILLLNPDTIVYPDTIKKMISLMDSQKDIGASTCKVVLLDGSLDLACRRSFPRTIDLFWKEIGFSKLFPNNKFFSRYNLLYLDENKSYDVECIVGAFMFIRKKVLDTIGLLDENFFMYGEDLDLCYRIIKSGWRIHYFPEAIIIHHKGASSIKHKAQSKIEFYRAFKILYKKYYAQANTPIFNQFIYFMIDLKLNLQKFLVS